MNWLFVFSFVTDLAVNSVAKYYSVRWSVCLFVIGINKNVMHEFS